MRKVCGVGINDLGYKTQEEVVDITTGKRKVIWRCPYYKIWSDMLTRCYSRRYQNKTTYTGCEVSDSWKYFSNFKFWLESQNYETGVGLEIDKDILGTGKLYSESNCVLVFSLVNCFIIDSKKIRGNLPIGVSFDKPRNKYRACCRNPFHDRKRSNSSKYIGLFSTPELAHEAWRQKKEEYATQLANSDYVTCPKVAKVLVDKYSFTDWYKN